jgi:hypothetical protein
MGYDASAYVEKHGVGVYKSLFGRGDAFTCSSEFMRGRVVDIGCPAKKLAVFKLGTDLGRIPFQERIRSPKRARPVSDRCAFGRSQTNRIGDSGDSTSQEDLS